MTWAKFADDYDDETAYLSHEAFRLFTCAITYSRRNGRAGRLHLERDLKPLAAKLGIRHPNAAIAQLFSGTDDDEPVVMLQQDFAVIRNYDKYNPPTSRERMRKHRAKDHENVTSQPRHGDAPVTKSDAASRARPRAGYPVPVPVSPNGDNPHVPLTTQNGRPKTDTITVFDTWKEATGHSQARLTEDRRRKITARLREYPLEDLLDAVRGSRFDPWEGRRDHDDLTVLLRDGTHVEKFRDLYRHGQQASPVLTSMEEMMQ